MDIDFLGVGWSLPIQLDQTQQIQTAKYEAAVRQSIWAILSTARGERLMRPEFVVEFMIIFSRRIQQER